MEWINVKDRLPNENITVLVANVFDKDKWKLDIPLEGHITLAERYGMWWKEIDGEIWKIGTGNFEYWMPLPDLPKK